MLFDNLKIRPKTFTLDGESLFEKALHTHVSHLQTESSTHSREPVIGV